MGSPASGSRSTFLLAGILLSISTTAIRPGAAAAGIGSIDGQDIVSIDVIGTNFRIERSDGRLLSNDDLVGAVLAFADGAGGTMEVRIESIAPDPKDRDGDVLLYDFSVRDPATGEWDELCDPDPDGLRRGFPLAGTWSRSGEHIRDPKAFSLTCTAGAQGKCVRFGYKPWKRAPDGTSLWDYHQACTRLLRGDYCGDGTPHTRDGTMIDLYDRFAIQRDEALPGMSFEAAWDAEGAVCVRRPRIPDLISLEMLGRSCPRLAARLGEGCREEELISRPGVLLLDKSF